MPRFEYPLLRRWSGLMRRCVFLSLICAIGGSAWSYAYGAPSTAPETLAAFVAQELDHARVPGAALVVIQGDRVVLRRGFGRAGPSGRAVTPATPFIIGSLSKSLTALALMQLVEDGRVNLDVPVQHYLPWFRLADPQAAAQITVRHALTHTTGIAWVDGLTTLDSRDTAPDAITRRVAALRTVQPVQPPGSSFIYSNVNYVMVGAMIEAVTGAPYEAAIRQRIFAPLRMRASFAGKAEAGTALAIGHRYWFGRPVAAPDLPYGRSDLPSFLLIASANDLGRYLQAQLNGGLLDGTRVLSEAGMRTLQHGTAPTPWGDQYAMGWFDERWDGIRVLNHYGSYAGYHANMLLAPESGWGLVLLTNAESYVGNERRWDIAKNGFRLLLGLPLAPPAPISPTAAAFGVLLTLLLALVIDIAITTHRQLRGASSRPQPWSRRIDLPLVAYLSLAALFLIGVPRIFDATLRAILLTTPDVGWVLVLGAVGAFVGILLRVVPARPVAMRRRKS